MSRLYRISTLVVLLFTASYLGCSSTPKTDDTTTEAQALTGPADLIQTDDVLVALRINADGLATLTPLLQRIAQSTDERILRELADISPDPIGHFQSIRDLPNDLPSLNREEAGYVLLSSRGNTEFIAANSLGLPTRVDEAPHFMNVRALLPTDAPEQLREELAPWLESIKENPEIAAARLFDGPGFVRVELAISLRSHLDASNADEWLDALRLDQLQPPSTAEYRPTPAFDAFVDSDAPLGVWAPVANIGTLGVLEVFEIFHSERDMVGPAGTPRFSLEGVARVAAAASVVDPVSAENEDFSVLFFADEAGALIVDTYNTRTAQGVRVHHALDEPVDLPGFTTSNTFLQLNWQANLETLQNVIVSPHWQLIEPAEEEWGMAGGGGAAQGLRGLTSNPIGPVADNATLPTLAILLQYPWTTLTAGAQSMSGLFPMPRAIALEAFAIPNSDMLPVGAVIAGTFPDTPENRSIIELLLAQGESFIPVGFDATLQEREDDLLEVRIAVGEELAKIFNSTNVPNQVGDTLLSMDITPLQMLRGMIPGSEAMDFFDHVHLRSHTEETYSTFRITIGAPAALAPHPVESRVEPLANPTYRCQAEISSAAVEHLMDLRTDPTGRVELWAAAVQEEAQKCMDPSHPATSMIQERIELAREIAAEIP